MAVTNLTITQDNTGEGGNIAVACNNPLTILVYATYTGSAPDYLTVALSAIDAGIETQLETLLARPYEDVDETHRYYYIEVRNIMKGYLPAMSDFGQSDGTLVYCSNLQRLFKFVFSSDGVTATTQILGVNAVRQIGENPCLVDLTDNANTDLYTGADDEPVYCYYYNNDPNNVISLTTVSGQLLPPSISPANGNKWRPLNVTLSNTQGATMHYTLNGDEPTESSTLYTDDFEITTPGYVTIKAKCYKNGSLPSETASMQYLLVQDLFDADPVPTDFIEKYYTSKQNITQNDASGELLLITTEAFPSVPFVNYQLSNPKYLGLIAGNTYVLEFNNVWSDPGTGTAYLTIYINNTLVLFNRLLSETPIDLTYTFIAVGGDDGYKLQMSGSSNGADCHIGGINLFEY